MVFLRVQAVQERLRVDKDNARLKIPISKIAFTLSNLSRSCTDCTLGRQQFSMGKTDEKNSVCLELLFHGRSRAKKELFSEHSVIKRNLGEMWFYLAWKMHYFKGLKLHNTVLSDCDATRPNMVQSCESRPIAGLNHKRPNSSDLATRCCRVAMVSFEIKNVFNTTLWL